MYQILPANLMYPLMSIFFSMFSIISLLIYFNIMSNEYMFMMKNNKMTKSVKSKLEKTILSLFVSFDSHSSVNLLGMNELNWMTIILITFAAFYSFWNMPSRVSFFLSKLLKMMKKQFMIALKSKKDGSNLIFCAIFLFFVFCNMLGLLPNVFTPSSHMTLNLMFSIPLWSGFLMYGWYTYSNKMFAHLVPLSTPSPLISFMVMIELVSTMIRPSTLSIRLMANMVSGHLLFTLIGNNFASSSMIYFLILLLTQTLLSLLEIGVSMIQAYVFSILLTLYSDESDFSSK